MRILLFTGKGGVGKTTTAAATAVRLAERGQKILLLSTDAAHSVGDVLGVAVGVDPTEVTPGLWAVQPDAQRQLESAWHQVQRYLVELLDRSGLDPVAAEELTVLPGIEEVLALLAVRDYANRGDWDALVIDGAATAETLRLLALPDALQWYLEKIFPLQRRMARGLRPLVALLGRGDALPPDDLFASLLALCDELDSVRTLLADQRTTSVRLVLTPEAMVVAEARRTFTALCLYGYQVDLVVANRLFPPNAADGPWLRRWVDTQQAQLAVIADSFIGAAVQTVHYAEAEPIGLAALGRVADELYGPLPGRDPGEVGELRPNMSVERVPGNDLFLLTVLLPLAQAAEVDAVRVGDELVLTVGGRRRILTLPSVLRRCNVAGAGFIDGRLELRFVPDPALWPAAHV